MEVASVSAASAATRSESQIAANFDTFLLLLTAQLKNQDPLEPMDSNQFTQQLVQFSQVEQQINANKNLESLIALTKARSSSDAVSYLGKTLTLTDGTAALMGGEAIWAYSLENDAVERDAVRQEHARRCCLLGPGRDLRRHAQLHVERCRDGRSHASARAISLVGRRQDRRRQGDWDSCRESGRHQ